MTTVVYTDGACIGNPGPGGWAWAVERGPYASGPAAKTTNQRMEITAVVEALAAVDGALEIRSDSTYVVNCFRQEWWKGWIARGWKNSKKQPVANRDLWEPLVVAVRARDDVSFSWVKGHSGDAMNDAVDALAVDAARSQAPRSGDRLTPEVVADLEPDRPGSTGAAAGGGVEARLRGHGVVVTGHRPPELGGYDTNPLADAVRVRFEQILAAKAEVDPELVVATGLGLGAEQLGAEAAASAGIPYVAVLPFPEPDAVWPRESRRRFAALRVGADEVVTVQRKEPRSRVQAGAAIGRRDAWLARHCREAVVVWNGRDADLGRTVTTLEESLDDVWVVDPAAL